MIHLYKTRTCVYCPMVMRFYDAKGVKYEIHPAEGPVYTRLANLYGTSVPLLYNDETDVGFVGYDIGKLIKLAGL